jgi:hypothetical protein
MTSRRLLVIVVTTLLVIGGGPILLIDQSIRYAAKQDKIDRQTTMKIIDRIGPLAPDARIVQGDQSSARSWIVATLPLPRRSDAFEIGGAMIDPETGILHCSFKAGGRSSEQDMTADQFGYEVQKRAVVMGSADG